MSWVYHLIDHHFRLNMYCMRGSRNFRQGGSRSISQKSSDNLFFFSPPLIFTEVKWLISKITIIFQGFRGGPTFSRGGVQLFPGGGGSNCSFPIETLITCDFPGGSGHPVPPSGSALVNWLLHLQSVDNKPLYC